jgi:hypothetical protein
MLKAITNIIKQQKLSLFLVFLRNSLICDKKYLNIANEILPLPPSIVATLVYEFQGPN